MFTGMIFLPLLLQPLAVYAQTSTASVASAVSAVSSAPTATKSLGPNEAIVVEPIYDSSRSSVLFTTYTTTTATAATELTQPTDLPSSLYCRAGFANATGPFCYPTNGTQQIKGKQYSVTWNPLYASNCTDVFVALLYYQNQNGQLVDSIRSTNAIGFWNYTVESSWLNGQSSQYAQLQFVPFNCNGKGTVDPISGPIVELLSKAPTQVEGATPESEVLGLSIGLPLALAAFVGTALFVMWWNKGHRKIPNFAKRNKGYTGRRQRAVRLADMGDTQNGETYRDHPASEA